MMRSKKQSLKEMSNISIKTSPIRENKNLKRKLINNSKENSI
jgi:hypothetical protein